MFFCFVGIVVAKIAFDGANGRTLIAVARVRVRYNSVWCGWRLVKYHVTETPFC